MDGRNTKLLGKLQKKHMSVNISLLGCSCHFFTTFDVKKKKKKVIFSVFICRLSLERKKKQDRNTCICKIHAPVCVQEDMLHPGEQKNWMFGCLRGKKKSSVEGFLFFKLALIVRTARPATLLQWRIGVPHCVFVFWSRKRMCRLSVWCGPIRLNFMTSSP